MLKPLNAKFGKENFHLSSIRNLQIEVKFSGSSRAAKVTAQFEENPPSSLATANPVRLDQVAATRGALEKVEKMNPAGVEKVRELRRSGGKRATEEIKKM